MFLYKGYQKLLTSLDWESIKLTFREFCYRYIKGDRSNNKFYLDNLLYVSISSLSNTEFDIALRFIESSNIISSMQLQSSGSIVDGLLELDRIIDKASYFYSLVSLVDKEYSSHKDYIIPVLPVTLTSSDNTLYTTNLDLRLRDKKVVTARLRPDITSDKLKQLIYYTNLPLHELYKIYSICTSETKKDLDSLLEIKIANDRFIVSIRGTSFSSFKRRYIRI